MRKRTQHLREHALYFLTVVLTNMKFFFLCRPHLNVNESAALTLDNVILKRFLMSSALRTALKNIKGTEIVLKRREIQRELGAL